MTFSAFVPSGFSSGVAAAIAAGVSIVLLVPFLWVAYRLVRRLKIAHLLRKSAFIAAVSIILAIVVSGVTSQPFFCRTCHAMRPSADSWAQGPHKTETCLACHREKGFGGITIRKLEDVRMLGTFFVESKPRGLNKPIRDEICLGCHDTIASEPSVEKSVRVSHREFVGQSIMCSECHSDASHSKQKKSKAQVMEKCALCHDGRTVSADCSVCHLNKQSKKKKPPESSGIGHGERWLQIHGVKSQGICTACHAREHCAKCHTDVPHPDGWSLQHGEESAKDEATCLTCHIDGRGCDNCHQLPMPHQAGWLDSHAASSKQRGTGLCNTCHLERDCTACHDNHRNLPQVKKVRSRAQ